jgi:hypothetical protein
MSYIELQSDDPTPESARMFWQSITELGIAEVAIEVVTETATLEATSLRWRATGLGPIGVLLCIFNLMQFWGKLASSETTDAEYDVAIDKEIQTVINLFESVRPSNIRAEYSNSNSIFYSST